MMNYATLLQQIAAGDEVARAEIYALDEEAITPLIDEFYAGVNEATGLIIIEILSDIGGFEARMLLEDVVHLSARYLYETWRLAARLGLAQYQ